LPCNAANAAFTAAVAHAPVVHPRLNSPSGFSNRIERLYKGTMSDGPTKTLQDWIAASAPKPGFARLDGERFPDFAPGSVWLVGAGPGAPGLMSLLCYHALQVCDVVVYDALVNADILRWVRAGAELEYAGKRGGKPSPVQRDISIRLIELARAGKRVLRLKGGDPFMFGRGGEECQHLAAAGLPFRIVPGITAGVGGLAYAGLPATHRDTNHSVIFLTGHDATGKLPANVNWQAVAQASPVIVMYMAVKNLGEIAGALISGGRPGSDPVTIISNASLPSQTVVTTTLAEAGAFVAANQPPTPAIVVAGQAASWREVLDWYGPALRENPIG
jgi:uroporphyrin-III C-methyltransferase